MSYIYKSHEYSDAQGVEIHAGQLAGLPSYAIDSYARISKTGKPVLSADEMKIYRNAFTDGVSTDYLDIIFKDNEEQLILSPAEIENAVQLAKNKESLASLEKIVSVLSIPVVYHDELSSVVFTTNRYGRLIFNEEHLDCFLNEWLPDCSANDIKLIFSVNKFKEPVFDAGQMRIILRALTDNLSEDKIAVLTQTNERGFSVFDAHQMAQIHHAYTVLNMPPERISILTSLDKNGGPSFSSMQMSAIQLHEEYLDDDAFRYITLRNKDGRGIFSENQINTLADELIYGPLNRDDISLLTVTDENGNLYFTTYEMLLIEKYLRDNRREKAIEKIEEIIAQKGVASERFSSAPKEMPFTFSRASNSEER